MPDNFVVRYRGAFSRKECADLVEYIDYLDNNNLLFYDTEKLHQVDNKTINVNNGFNLDVTAASRISQQILPNMKVCIDEYVNMFSLLQQSEFAVYDCKLKKYPLVVGSILGIMKWIIHLSTQIFRHSGVSK
ncbi:MAG: hypothetical protein CM15mV26_1170 [uncultured marine virus]|nr:MAG: hypothetical protein CM15mV26_1170 [uncultured marine virus]